MLSNHRDHLRLAWNAVRVHRERAEDVVADHIQAYAAAHGQAQHYHDTMTRFWVRLVSHCVGVQPEIDDFEEFLTRFPMLLDKKLFGRHWSHEAMFAPEARAAWREPDLIALPF